MTRYVLAITLLVCLAATGRPPAAATPDETIAATYGKDLAQAERTPEPADDVALGRRMLDDARNRPAADPLVPALCDKAYALTVDQDGGIQIAVDAMTCLAEAVPDRRQEARTRTIDARQQHYQKSRGRERGVAGERLLATLVQIADELLASARFAQAATLYRRALPLATNLHDINRNQIEAKLEYAQTRQAFISQADRLKTHLTDKPDDRQARDKLVRILALELDDPQAAAKQIDFQRDDPTNKYILLAGMSVEKLPAPACAALGTWYHNLATGASTHGRILALERARTYYRRFLETAKPDAADRPAVEQALARANDTLADIAATSPALTLLTCEEFTTKFADRFPASNNVAGKGAATASSNWGDRKPGHALRGERTGAAWSLGGPSGWFRAEWDPPVSGRYILLFGRDGAPGGNPWGRAFLTINDANPRRIVGMSSAHVFIIDLGLTVPVKNLKLQIQGKMYPGLAAVEIHPGEDEK